jgi:hypothetical protein
MMQMCACERVSECGKTSYSGFKDIVHKQKKKNQNL